MQKIKLQTKPNATTDRLTTFRLDPGEVNKGGGGSGDDRSHQYKLALNRFSQLPVRARAEKRNSAGVVVAFSFFDSLIVRKLEWCPGKEAALNKIYTRHKQTNKQPTTHTQTHIKLSGNEAWSKADGPDERRMEKTENTTSKQAKTKCGRKD